MIRSQSSCRPCLYALALFGLAALGTACDGSKSGTRRDPAPSAQRAKPLELVMAFGSEKKTWIEAELPLFQATSPKTKSGRKIRVVAKSMGSGEAMQVVLSGHLRAHVFSPASGAYVTLLNDAWLARGGHTKPLAAEGEPLILSPLVIAMWQPMAQALGWPERPIGWKDVIAMGKQPQGWAAHGRAEWGRFKLGHTHPEYSNSGLLSVLAEAYAGAGKTRELTVADLDKPETRAFVGGVEHAIVHYGKSTGLFSDQMRTRGPSYLSAAVTYENLVIESRATKQEDNPPLVAIYPVEGTFWSDHPFCVLDAPWTTDEHREAAAMFGSFLHSRASQQRALALGFRPADPAIAIASPIDAAHGVDPLQPQTLLDVPGAPTLNALLALFRAVKKSSSVTLVFDKSGSMKGKAMTQAKAGAKAFLRSLESRDEVALTFFDTHVYPSIGPIGIGKDRKGLEQRIEAVVADGGTALHDAVGQAYAEAGLRAAGDPNRIHALVVMTDGKDEHSTLLLENLMPQLATERADRDVRIFTLAYGDASETAVLKRISEAGGGSFTKGGVADIVQVYRDIASFF